MKRILIAFIILLSVARATCYAQPQTIVWGDNSFGQTNVPPQATNILALSAGDSHCLALRRDGTVIGWGENNLGQTNVPADLTNAIAIATGSTHSMALRGDGTISFWGRFFLSAGTTTPPPTATNVVALGMGAGPTHAVVLRADGTAVDWGDTNYTSTNMPPDAIDLVSVAAGSFSSFGLRADGRVVSWGNPNYNGLNVPLNATNIVAIATGYADAVALRADGTILAWGTSSPAPTSGFTNLLDVVCPFDNLFDTHNGILGLRRDGTAVEYLGTTIPKYATNQIGVVGAGGLNALMAVGTGSPVFTGLPVNHTVPAGSRAYFRAVAVGQLPITYQWTCDGTNMPGATNSVMVLTNVQPDLEGTYYSLTASNSPGSTNFGPMYLSVNPLEIGFSPQSLTVIAGSNATFAASVQGKGPFSYQWQFAGTNLDGYTNSSLSITNVQMNQAGAYSLSVSNAFGSVTNSSVLNVVPLEVTIQPQNVSILAGTNLVLTATAIGQGPFSYQWRFNETNIDGETAETLNFSSVSPGQAGAYSVIASNDFGAVTSSNAWLTVIPLQIVSQPQSQIGYVGLGAAFAVVPAFQVPFTYQWQYMGVPIPGATNSQLLLTNLQINQAGAYSVVVSNQFGGVQSVDAMLAVKAIAAWGDNSYGQTNVPSALTNAIAIAAGYGLSMALTKEHNIIAWGANNYNRTNVPPDLTNAIAIAAGYSHCLAIRPDGTVRTWGSYFDGSNYYPATPPSDLSNVVAIAAGNYHAVALRSDGTVSAWGYGFYGQTNVPPGLTNVVAISAGGYCSLALKSDGTVVSWGSQGWDETNIPPGLSNVTAISAGIYHGLALNRDGSVVGWGNNAPAQIDIPPDLTNAVAVSGGNFYSAALRQNGALIVWGSGPTNVPVNLTSARSLATGDNHTLALPGIRATSQPVSGSWQGGNFTVSLPSTSGRVYMLEYKDSLTDPVWKPLPLAAGTGETLNLKDFAPQSGQRFYRVRQW